VLHSVFLNGRFPVKGELESVTAAEQMRTEQATTGVHSKGEYTDSRRHWTARIGQGILCFASDRCGPSSMVHRHTRTSERQACGSAQIERHESCSSESQTQSFAVRGTTHATWPCMVLRAAPHGLLVLLLPRAFAAPYLTPQGAHHHHPNHGDPELHAKPNGIQCVHRPPPLTTGCTPIRSRCPISR